MKKYSALIFVSLLLLSGCSKEQTEQTATQATKQAKEVASKAKENVETAKKEVVAATATTATTAQSVSLDEVIKGAQETKIRIRAKESGGTVSAKVGIKHPMLTYNQAKEKGVPVNFITHISAYVDNTLVYDASTSQFLSKNPLIKFQFKGKKGQTLTVVYKQYDGKRFYGQKPVK